uniref:Uncharacterized protein n=1 Tax=Rhizophora mucronata TaxID=61149 RepID=A0A2P2NUN2_RHIMU
MLKSTWVVLSLSSGHPLGFKLSSSLYPRMGSARTKLKGHRRYVTIYLF